MKINSTLNNKYNAPFGTLLGTTMQKKIILCKNNNLFSAEQNAVLKEIENDGFNAILDIVDKYVVKRINNKSSFDVYKCLAVIYENNKIVIDSMEQIFKPGKNNKFFYFFPDKFVKLFDPKNNLAGKIKSVCESADKK